jgi:hypothetical protein
MWFPSCANLYPIPKSPISSRLSQARRCLLPTTLGQPDLFIAAIAALKAPATVDAVAKISLKN